MPNRSTPKTDLMKAYSEAIMRQIICHSRANSTNEEPSIWYFRKPSASAKTYSLDLEQTAELYETVAKAIRQRIKDDRTETATRSCLNSEEELSFKQIVSQFYCAPANEYLLKDYPREHWFYYQKGLSIASESDITLIVSSHHPLGQQCSDGDALYKFLKRKWDSQKELSHEQIISRFYSNPENEQFLKDYPREQWFYFQTGLTIASKSDIALIVSSHYKAGQQDNKGDALRKYLHRLWERQEEQRAFNEWRPDVSDTLSD